MTSRHAWCLLTQLPVCNWVQSHHYYTAILDSLLCPLRRWSVVCLSHFIPLQLLLFIIQLVAALSLLGEDNWNNLSRKIYSAHHSRDRSHCRLALWLWDFHKVHDRSIGYRGCSPPGCQAKGRRKGVLKDAPPMSINSNQFQQFSIVLSAENEAWRQEHVKAFKTWTITKL